MEDGLLKPRPFVELLLDAFASISRSGSSVRSMGLIVACYLVATACLSVVRWLLRLVDLRLGKDLPWHGPLEAGRRCDFSAVGIF